MPPTKPYPIHHENDKWGAPDVFFVPGVSLSSGRAAAFLGVSRHTLIRYADELGLTVLRKPYTFHRYFLVSELKHLREVIDTLSTDDALDLKVIRDGIVTSSKRGRSRKKNWRLIRRRED